MFCTVPHCSLNSPVHCLCKFPNQDCVTRHKHKSAIWSKSWTYIAELSIMQREVTNGPLVKVMISVYWLKAAQVMAVLHWWKYPFKAYLSVSYPSIHQHLLCIFYCISPGKTGKKNNTDSFLYQFLFLIFINTCPLRFIPQRGMHLQSARLFTFWRAESRMRKYCFVIVHLQWASNKGMAYQTKAAIKDRICHSLLMYKPRIHL